LAPGRRRHRAGRTEDSQVPRQRSLISTNKKGAACAAPFVFDI
jgi:hypothetical protein